MNVIKFVTFPDAPAPPNYASEGAAGADLSSAEDHEILSQDWAPIRTGYGIELPEGYEAQIRPRSGLALKHGITVLNAPGTIDSDYRGEIGVVLINHSGVPFQVTRGMRIAQLVISKVEKAVFVKVDSLDVTARGSGGYGSTGT